MYKVEIIADSKCARRLTTFVVTFPRIILAEVNTHRMLSRSSASSRAIPVQKQIDKVLNHPFVPMYWGKNQKGMQADEELSFEQQELARERWLCARTLAVQQAEDLMRLGVHKQITNRLLEPFMWHTAILSATDWRNFYNRRHDKDAQPEFRILAEMMLEEHKKSQPRIVGNGYWHLPFISEEEVPYNNRYGIYNQKEDRTHGIDLIDGKYDPIKVSVGRCARVSYLNHDGVRNPAEDVALGTKLVERGHPAPTEHAAMSQCHSLYIGNFRGWKQFRKYIPYEEAMPQADGQHLWDDE